MSERIELLNGLGWAELGCWIDGHWGQYGPDRLVAIAVTHGWTFAYADDRFLAEIAQARLDEIGPAGTLTSALCENYVQRNQLDFEHSTDPEGEIISMIFEMSDNAAEYLNSICPDGYSFGWHDGEFYLWDDDDWKETP